MDLHSSICLNSCPRIDKYKTELRGRNLRIKTRMWTFPSQVNLWSNRQLLIWETICLNNHKGNRLQTSTITSVTTIIYCAPSAKCLTLWSMKNTREVCVTKSYTQTLCCSELGQGQLGGLGAGEETKVHALGQMYHPTCCAVMQSWSLSTIPNICGTWD